MNNATGVYSSTLQRQMRPLLLLTWISTLSNLGKRNGQTEPTDDTWKLSSVLCKWQASGPTNNISSLGLGLPRSKVTCICHPRFPAHLNWPPHSHLMDFFCTRHDIPISVHIASPSSRRRLPSGHYYYRLIYYKLPHQDDYSHNCCCCIWPQLTNGHNHSRDQLSTPLSF